MSGCGDQKNPLQRSGTSQQQRLLAGLQPGYVRVDERHFADWIYFAAELSRYLNYFNAKGIVTGDWTPFFNSDVSAVLGSVAIQDADKYRQEIKSRFDFLKDEDHAVPINPVKENLTELFAAIFSFSHALDVYIMKLSDELSVKFTLQNLIERKLAPALQRLIGYYKGAKSLGFLREPDISGWNILNVSVVDARDIVEVTGLQERWWTGASDWDTYVANIPADESIFGDATWADFRRINHAAHHNLFASVFDQYLSAYVKTVQESEKELLKTLGDWDTHPAHYALFLSFLKLFQLVQSSANTITERHLDFYYKEVLRMLPKEAEPNKAHVLVELAKQINEHALVKDTLFKAGKDSAGNEVRYGLDEEQTFHKAKVALLKSVYKGNATGSDDHLQNKSLPSITVNNKGRLFAADVTNSEDGLGADLKSENKEWHPFVHKVFEEGVLTDIHLPPAQIGFAIASNYLLLTEGERSVFIRLATSGNAALNNVPIDCYLTTEKEWFKVEGNPTFSTGTMTDTTPCAQLSFTLPGDAPPITNFNSDVHGGNFNAAVPVLKVYIKNEEGTAAYPYDALKDLTVTKIEVEVKVGLNNSDGIITGGLKNLMLSNDTGVLDPSKPFLPFGPLPKKNNALIIGNEELFKKKNAHFRLQFEWTNMPTHYWHIDFETPDSWAAEGSDLYPKVSTKYLARGTWKDLISGGTDIFNENATVIQFPASLQSLSANNNEVAVAYENDYHAYDIKSVKGFIKLQLNGDFGHELYQKTLTEYLIDQAKRNPTGIPGEPTAPYTPTIQSISLHYKASAISEVSSTSESVFRDRALNFFHLYPFGEAEQHNYSSGSASIYVLPQFRHNENNVLEDSVGEFYIGVLNLLPQQSVNILFQVLEGSSDPLIEKPDEHVFWSYLSNNEWKPFEQQNFSDATRQLVQSGIITFIIPEDATVEHTLLPAGYIWLRASVAESAEAVCKLLAIAAQAAVVSFRPNNNAADFLNAALPAGSVSKLKNPEAAVKKVEQPFASFGGRGKEGAHQFYIRVSERLRHKSRAITIWDYEHLILEHFPQIHKVKCLNHTQIEDGIYNEVAPGYVGIITVPSLVNRNDANPLRPYTSQNVLLEIEEYLKKKISCHVKVRVRNPQFEEVRLSFSVKLHEGFDDFTFYAKQLQQEITEFLTPWAFKTNLEVQFGGKIYKSTLIDFIEERPYVDFITDVAMYHRIDEKSTVESGDQEEIIASTARSILVSAPASKHQVLQIVPAEETVTEECLPSGTIGNS